MTNYRFIKKDEICHYGIPRQKWGVRNYQYTDGSLTPEGRERYRKTQNKIDKIQKKIKRLEIEKDYDPNDPWFRNQKTRLQKKINDLEVKREIDFVSNNARSRGRITFDIDRETLKKSVEEFDKNQKEFETVAKDIIENEVGDFFDRVSPDGLNSMYSAAYDKFLTYKANSSSPNKDTFENFIESLSAIDFSDQINEEYERDFALTEYWQPYINKGEKQLKMISKKSPAEQSSYLSDISKNMLASRGDKDALIAFKSLSNTLSEKYGKGQSEEYDNIKSRIDAAAKKYWSTPVNTIESLAAYKEREKQIDDLAGFVLRDLGLDDNDESRKAIKPIMNNGPWR